MAMRRRFFAIVLALAVVEAGYLSSFSFPECVARLEQPRGRVRGKQNHNYRSKWLVHSSQAIYFCNFGFVSRVSCREVARGVKGTQEKQPFEGRSNSEQRERKPVNPRTGGAMRCELESNQPRLQPKLVQREKPASHYHMT